MLRYFPSKVFHYLVSALRDEAYVKAIVKLGLICSGNGECPCDRCHCTEDGYSGEFCEICVTCDDQCDKLRPCFECVAFENPSLFRQTPENGDAVRFFFKFFG